MIRRVKPKEKKAVDTARVRLYAVGMAKTTTVYERKIRAYVKACRARGVSPYTPDIAERLNISPQLARYYVEKIAREEKAIK